MSVDLNRWDFLENIGGLDRCIALTSLDMTACRYVRNILPLAACTALTTLKLLKCHPATVREQKQQFMALRPRCSLVMDQ